MYSKQEFQVIAKGDNCYTVFLTLRLQWYTFIGLHIIVNNYFCEKFFNGNSQILLFLIYEKYNNLKVIKIYKDKFEALKMLCLYTWNCIHVCRFSFLKFLANLDYSSSELPGKKYCLTTKRLANVERFSSNN